RFLRLLSHFLELRSTPGKIRTCDPRFRKPMLYPLSYGGCKDLRQSTFFLTPGLTPATPFHTLNPRRPPDGSERPQATLTNTLTRCQHDRNQFYRRVASSQTPTA